MHTSPRVCPIFKPFTDYPTSFLLTTELLSVHPNFASFFASSRTLNSGTVLPFPVSIELPSYGPIMKEFRIVDAHPFSSLFCVQLMNIDSLDKSWKTGYSCR